MGQKLRKLLAVLVALTGIAAIWSHSFGNSALFPPQTGAPRIDLIVVDHGYHAGLIFRRSDVQRMAAVTDMTKLQRVLLDFDRSEFVEIGWGDEGFYRHVPNAASLTIKLAARAFLGLNEQSVVRVVGYPASLPSHIPVGIARQLGLSESGAASLLSALEATLAADADGEAIPMPSSDPYGQYFAALGRYHAFNVCNHWVGRLLNAAGLPVNFLLATSSRGLLWQVGGVDPAAAHLL